MNAHVVPVVMLWLVVAARVSMLRRPGTSRVLWVTLALLAAAQTLQLKSLYQWTNEASGSLVGASVLKLSLAVAACGGLRTLIATLPPRGPSAGSARPAWLLAGITILVSAVPVLVWPPRQLYPAAVVFAQFYDPTWRSAVHWLPFLAYLSWAMAGGVSLFWAYGGQAQDRQLATGLRVVAVGCAVGFAYVALKLAVLTVWHVDTPAAPGWMDVTEGTVGQAVLATCIGLIALGTAWEAITGRLRAGRDLLWARWALWQLRPLWAALVAQHPGISLDDAAPSPVRRARYRLLRLVVEIRDGVLALEQTLGAAAVTEATTRVETAGYHGDDASAMILGIMVAASATPNHSGGGAELPTGGGTDLKSEVRWLTKAAKSYKTATATGPATTRRPRPR